MQVHEFSLCRYHNCGCIAGCFGVSIDDSYNNMRDICSWCEEKKQLVRYGMLGKYHSSYVPVYIHTPLDNSESISTQVYQPKVL